MDVRAAQGAELPAGVADWADAVENSESVSSHPTSVVLRSGRYRPRHGTGASETVGKSAKVAAALRRSGTMRAITRPLRRYPAPSVFLAGALALAIRVLVPVPVGLADNSDGQRMLCQIGAEPAGGWHDSDYWTYLRLVYAHTSAPCQEIYSSSQLPVVRLAGWLTRMLTPDRALDLRFVALINILLWAGALTLLFVAAPGRRALRLAAVGGVLAILLDPIFADYIISPYSEPAAVTGALYTLGGALLMRKRGRASYVGAAFLVAGAVFMAVAKTQSMTALVAVAVLVLLFPVGFAAGWRRGARLGVKLGILAAIGGGVALFPPTTTPGVGDFVATQSLSAEDRYDLMFVQVLPFDGGTAADLRQLGYPTAAAQYEGQPIWCIQLFDPKADKLPDSIEARLSYPQIAGFLAGHPKATFDVLQNASKQGFLTAQPTSVHCPDYNTRLGDYTESASSQIAYDHRFVPLTLVLDALKPFGLPAVLLIWTACLWAAVSARRRRVLVPLADTVLVMLTLWTAQFLTAAFGDGVDYAKHMNLAIFAAALAASGSLTLVAIRVRTYALAYLRRLAEAAPAESALVRAVGPYPAAVGLYGARAVLRDLAGRRPRRFAAMTWIGAGVVFLAWVAMFIVRHEYLWQQIDLDTYVKAVAPLPGRQNALYDNDYGSFGGPFLYPPFAALLIKPLALMPEAALRFVMAALSVLSLAAAVRCSWYLLGLRGSRAWAASALTFALSLWLEPVIRTVSDGQVSLLLWAAVAADFCLARRRGQGVLVGIATGFKLTPGIFIVYYLITGRGKAALTAAASTAVTMAIGWAVLPRASAEYWFHAITGTNRLNAQVTIGDSTNQSLRALIFRLAPKSDLVLPIWLLCSMLIVAAGLYAAHAAWKRGDDVLGICLAAATGLLIAPISWTHHWAPVVLFLAWSLKAVFTARRRAVFRNALVLTTGVVLLFLAYPMRLTFNGFWSSGQPLYPYGLVWLAPHADSFEFYWSPVDFVVGNLYVFAGVLLIGYQCATAIVRSTAAARPGGPAPAVATEPAAEAEPEPVPAAVAASPDAPTITLPAITGIDPLVAEPEQEYPDPSYAEPSSPALLDAVE